MRFHCLWVKANLNEIYKYVGKIKYDTFESNARKIEVWQFEPLVFKSIVT